MTHDTLVKEALSEIGKPLPADTGDCLYQSGILDSHDLMQLLLEIELRAGVQLDLAALMEYPITLSALNAAINHAQRART